MKPIIKFLSHKVIYLNVLAEFFASILYTLLYFVFISRYLSDNFNLDAVTLSYTIGFAFFAAIFIPFYTYQINIIPFVSIVNAIIKKQWVVILYKIPAQILGALIGAFFFMLINDATTNVHVHDIQQVELKDPWLIALINGAVAALLVYGFFVIRNLFKFKTLSGTIMLGLLVSFLFFIFHFLYGISALNPFGLLFIDLIYGYTSLSLPWYYWIIIHIISPIVLSIAVYFYLNGQYVKPKVKNRKDGKKNIQIPKYHI